MRVRLATGRHALAAGLIAALACTSAFAQEAPSAPASPPPSNTTSESRDAASAFIGSMNFTVGRIGRDCLAMLNRTETPQQFASGWQQRNSKYVTAAAKYLEARFTEASSKGEATRNALLKELAAVRKTAQDSVNGLYERNGKDATCKRMVGQIDNGTYDINPAVPMFIELEALVGWAQQAR